jgi:hypothetical protein
MELNRKFAQIIANLLNEENKKGLNREWTRMDANILLRLERPGRGLGEVG